MLCSSCPCRRNSQRTRQYLHSGKAPLGEIQKIDCQTMTRILVDPVDQVRLELCCSVGSDLIGDSRDSIANRCDSKWHPSSCSSPDRSLQGMWRHIARQGARLPIGCCRDLVSPVRPTDQKMLEWILSSCSRQDPIPQGNSDYRVRPESVQSYCACPS